MDLALHQVLLPKCMQVFDSPESQFGAVKRPLCWKVLSWEAASHESIDGFRIDGSEFVPEVLPCRPPSVRALCLLSQR